jgi:phosphoribosylformimino-5-aminoimidazole carboxamide ribotide isomerase
VRLRQGDFDQKTEYDATPLELAKEREAAGIRRLHMVDLDGARSGRPANLQNPGRSGRANPTPD